MANHACCFRGCGANATTLITDRYPDHPLFPTGAGLVCDQCATECADKGERIKIPWGVRKRMRL